MYRAVTDARSSGYRVVVVNQPYVSEQWIDEQRILRTMLQERFATDPRDTGRHCPAPRLAPTPPPRLERQAHQRSSTLLYNRSIRSFRLFGIFVIHLINFYPLKPHVFSVDLPGPQPDISEVLRSSGAADPHDPL